MYMYCIVDESRLACPGVLVNSENKKQVLRVHIHVHTFNYDYMLYSRKLFNFFTFAVFVVFICEIKVCENLDNAVQDVIML